MTAVHRLLRVSRVVADLGRAVAFYHTALDCRLIERGACEPTVSKALGIVAAEQAVLHLGAEEIALVQFATGAPSSPLRQPRQRSLVPTPRRGGSGCAGSL